MKRREHEEEKSPPKERKEGKRKRRNETEQTLKVFRSCDLENNKSPHRSDPNPYSSYLFKISCQEYQVPRLYCYN
jgi:hypothetical protein